MEKLYNSLRHEWPVVEVPEDIRKKALRPIQRMREISAQLGLRTERGECGNVFDKREESGADERSMSKASNSFECYVMQPTTSRMESPNLLGLS